MPVRDALDACKALAKSFNKSTTVSDQIQANQLHFGEKLQTIKQGVDTRWNSILANIKSIREAKDSVSAFCMTHKHDKSAVGAYSSMITSFPGNFWDLLDSIIAILAEFELSLKAVQVEKEITTHLVVLEYLRLKLFLDTSAPHNPHDRDASTMEDIGVRCKRILSMELDRKFQPFHPVELMAFALHPEHRISPSADMDIWNRLLEEGYGALEQELAKMASVGQNIPVASPSPSSRRRPELEWILSKVATTAADPSVEEVAKYKEMNVGGV